ncbi:molybdopterin-dependent oxidoreductase [Desulfosoma caldarium]|uniref:Formate dehydrogenase major subunit/formate dehydrogenase alpha subunit n=1 Tax=Desulfosoma caldarium TaxID=610254 RepID=A0A3N1UL93_9BACT|nr:molybdopterin-dependent oxidoreductase [Desulfosoma caldarium]ROQ92004.1 formate dehydrogenase major subunit/formate dehydrogenase alpha subunit [Desulfosoma caldarium]
MSDVNIWINDQQVKAKAGQTILQAADEAGIYVPRLCFHPALEPSGSCRLCAVEIEGQRGLPAACTTPVAEGLRVQTQTPKVMDFRREMLQLILRDHPRHCLGCPRNGTCELQQLVAAVGIDFPYPAPDVVRPQPLPGGPYFERDYSLCVRCGRCVRVCHEVRGARTIVFRESKDGRQSVGTPFDRSLEESGCQFCGACVDVCPVGALRENLTDFHRETRPAMDAVCQALTAIITNLYNKELETRWSTAICPVCSAGCRLMLEKTADETVIQVKPSPDGPSNKGQACVQGRFLLKRYVARSERLRQPAVKEGGSWKNLSWDEALQYAAEKFRSYAPNQVAVLTDGRLTNEELHVLNRLAREYFKTEHVGLMAPSGLVAFEKAATELLGTAGATNSLQDLAEASAIFAMGLNPAASQPIAGTAIRQAVLKGAKLVVANPYDVAIARYAHVHLRYVPGSETALVLGLVRIILDEKGVDKAMAPDVLAALKDLTAPFDVETVARCTGLHQEQLVEAGCMLAEKDTVAVLAGLGVIQSPHVADLTRALITLGFAKGSFGKRGGGFWPLFGSSNMQGARDQGWSTTVMDALASGNIRAAYVAAESYGDFCWQPLMACAQSLDFLVVQDVVAPPEAVGAHIVLPLTPLLEKDGSLTNGERRVQWTEKALTTSTGSRTVLETAAAWSRFFGKEPLETADPGVVMKTLGAHVPGYAGIDRSRARYEAVQVPCPSPDHGGTPVLFAEAPPVYKPWSPSQDLGLKAAAEASPEFPLRLTTKEGLYPSFFGPLLAPESQAVMACDGEIEMHPTDAYRLECMPGDTVAVVFNGGEISGRLAFNIHLPLKLVAVPAERLQSVLGGTHLPGTTMAAKVEKR